MRYRTQLMEHILTNEKAQEIIDYVSQIYGDSYVGLWFFQVIGSVLEPICDMSQQLTYETSPATATLLLSYYEAQYGIQSDSTMTTQQRQEKIMATIRSRGACTPERLAATVSAALDGVHVEVFERTGKNEFTVNIRGVVSSYAPGIEVIERMKPAHLIYKLQGVVQEDVTADINIGTAMTRAELYTLRASNSQTVIETPIMVEGSLKVRANDPITSTETVREEPHTSDGQGNVTTTTIKATNNEAGDVTLISRIVQKEEE